MRKMLLAAVLCAVSTAVLAEPPKFRTIDMTTVMTDLRGHPIPDMSQATAADPQCLKCDSMTLGFVVATGLLTPGEDDARLSAVEKAKRAALGLRLLDQRAAVLTATESAEILKAMRGLPALYLLRAVPLIDPAADLGQ